MKDWDTQRVAEAAGADLRATAPGGPARVVIDSRGVRPGDLFVGIPGERVDGGSFAAQVLEAGAWGVLVQPRWADGLTGGAVLAADDPVRALGALARGWRRALGAKVIGVTGSVGKTSTKDLIAGVLAPHVSVAASRENFNTEIGLPLELLAAPAGIDVVVLELAMRGAGQITELARICEPDVGVVTNVGPVHLELLGSIQAIAAAKGELLEALGPDATGVVPADEPMLHPFWPERVTTFGPGGDVDWHHDRLHAFGEGLDVEFGFDAAHQRRNAAAAVAAALAIGIRPGGRVEVAFSRLRGERITLPGGAVVINDCYNANPLSMRAALDDLASQEPAGRRVAVLGDMLELGPGEVDMHREIGAYARERGVELLITVGPLAAEMRHGFGGGEAVPDADAAGARMRELIGPGDVVLVKGSRGVGLEAVAEALVGDA